MNKLQTVLACFMSMALVGQAHRYHSRQPVKVRPAQCTERFFMYQEVSCMPRPTLTRIPLPPSVDILRMTPGHVMVNRCSGSCEDLSRSCIPKRVSNKTVKVVMVKPSYQVGHGEIECAEIEVEQHEECTCGCQEGPEDCSLLQVYDEGSCRCRCQDVDRKLECLARGKIWDEETCSCLCPRTTWQMCSTGYTYDFLDTCQCKITYLVATSGGLTALFIVACVSLVAGVLVIVKVRQGKRLEKSLQERRATIQRGLLDAFGEDTEDGPIVFGTDREDR